VRSRSDIDACWARLRAVEQQDILRDLLAQAAGARGEQTLQTLQTLRQPALPRASPVAPSAPPGLSAGTAQGAPLAVQIPPAFWPQVRTLHTQVSTAVTAAQQAAARQRAARRRQRLRRWLPRLALVCSLVLYLPAWRAQQAWWQATAEWQPVRVQQLQPVESELAKAQAESQRLSELVPQRQQQISEVQSEVADLEKRLPTN
jgi:hypothetical protein